MAHEMIVVIRDEHPNGWPEGYVETTFQCQECGFFDTYYTRPDKSESPPEQTECIRRPRG
jgi:hypothetical protein